MAWPDRVEMENGVYHAGWRGVLRGSIYLGDSDRGLFLDDLLTTARRFRWRLWLYTLLTNHFHLLVQTSEPNLSAGMQRLGSVYARRFNAIHGRSGHVFERRFWSRVVKDEPQLDNVLGYIRHNAVDAGLVDHADDWPWLGGSMLVRARRTPVRPDWPWPGV